MRQVPNGGTFPFLTKLRELLDEGNPLLTWTADGNFFCADLAQEGAIEQALRSK